jgi:hypothetical protein
MGMGSDTARFTFNTTTQEHSLGRETFARSILQDPTRSSYEGVSSIIDTLLPFTHRIGTGSW